MSSSPEALVSGASGKQGQTRAEAVGLAAATAEKVGPGLLLMHMRQDQKDPAQPHKCVCMPFVVEQQ